MSPSELIYFLIIGLILLLVLIVIGFILRKRKKWMITLMTLVVLCYVGYYVYFFTSKVNIHAERYEIVTEYLEDRYPDKEFTVLPKHYVEGYTVGQFQVNDIENPNMGVTLNVDKKERVSQTGYWSDHEYPTQQELWRVVQYQYGEPLTLDKETPVIVKIDEWIDGELTAFALKIDGNPAIAIFNYSSASYSLIEMREGEPGGVVSVELEDYVFVHIDERYQGETKTIHLKNGEEYELAVNEYKGKLFVKKH